ncbi:CDGSH iron-sulfur domain-containing protein [Streptomyces microflavus]|uniref:CDGSH iron-sulfur domain-containing protein n=1 Tax=Streptomyces microflavus TaxID=1919 RepID=UPI00367878C9
MVVKREGPILVEGPVEVVCDDGTTMRPDRFVVAICTCRRSRACPWCDTSHRRRKSAGTAEDRPDGRQPQEGKEEPRP